MSRLAYPMSETSSLTSAWLCSGMAVVDVDMQIVEDAEENYQVRGKLTWCLTQVW